jgi:branched-chain amino acid transport system substrate-binding protein
LVGVVVFMTDLKAIGLEAAEGLTFSTGFAADASPEAAKWSQRFLARHNAMPNDVQAGVYSATLHYLKAVREVGTNEARAVMAKMREMPVNDMFAKNGILRADGRMVHDMYLEQAKKRSESSGPWDLVTLVKTIPGDQAFRPLSESQCPLVAGVAK